MLDHAQVKENIDTIRKEIAQISEKYGRSAPPTLLAATKTVPAEQINFAIRECGITVIGENRVQELLEKYDALDRSAELHFIGRLQRNKVKYIVDKVSLIHSVDSIRLAEEIEKQAGKIDRRMGILLEVNSGREAQKGGFFPEDVEEALTEISQFPHIELRGLMAVAPICADQEEYLNYFSQISEKFIDISSKKRHNIKEGILSMGMSDSLEPAIAAGSTMVRLGSALFGKRIYN